MDSGLNELHDMVNAFEFDGDDFFSAHEQSPYLINGNKHDSLDLDVFDIPFVSFSPNSHDFVPLSTATYEAESPDDQDSDPVLKFLNEILIEENMEDKPSMFHDPLAIQAAEKSLYDVIGQKYPPSPDNVGNSGDQTSDSVDSFLWSSSEYASSSNAGSSSIDPQWIVDPGEYLSSAEQSLDSLSNPQAGSQLSLSMANGFNDNANIQVNSFENMDMLQNIFSDTESILQYNRGMEEASKFLPTGNQLIIDLDQYELPQKSEVSTPAILAKVENDETGHFPKRLKGRKHHHPEDSDSENLERNSKQPANYEEDVQLSEMFDRVLLFCDANGQSFCGNHNAESPDGVDTAAQKTLSPNGLSRGRARAKKNDNKKETVDLRTLLVSCAQSVASDDHRTAYEQLKQIRQNSSRTGDVYQRLANVFACGLEARLGGTGTELYASRACKKITAAEKLKAYQVYLSACPFKKMSIIFANKMIGYVATEGATLHIVDFGILYGFQWPILIQHFSLLPRGPSKLRITGIERPQPGFRPAESVEETGVRLKKYCERFGVSFEYRAIAVQNWETLKVEDLKIASDEVLAVNCLFRFDQLLDETVMDNPPRDVVLNLIREMKPNIFVNAISNGSYSSPFFVTRFREALFHYSALFDMFDSTLTRENQHRMHFEQDFYGREVINVVACEGAERVERPETYKQWQVRHMRAGFKPLPIKQELMKLLKHKVKGGYHKDFLTDEDGNWMLQGWKGRIMCASSCWIPVENAIN